MRDEDLREIQALLQEHARRQNPYFVRDSLPHPLAVAAYWLALQQNRQALDFDDVGLSVFSQNNEDGILLYLFSRIGFASRKCIEIGCNVDQTTLGIPEGNTINLIVNFGFHGLIIDMAPEYIGALQHFFASCLQTKHCHHADGFFSPVLVEARVTTDNINAIAAENRFSGDVDLMTIDVDGDDVTLLAALSAVSPRVLILEVNNRLPFEESIFAGPSPQTWTIEYSRRAGASLMKAIETAEAKGYVFVGMNNTLINAFFVRRDVAEQGGLKPADLEVYFRHRHRPPESFVPFDAAKEQR